MATPHEFEKRQLRIDVDGAKLDIAAIHRGAGELPPIVFLHGFGSTKEDYADIVRHPAFDGHPFLAYDAPGCGETGCSDLSRISIPFLVKAALAVLDHFGIARFHLVGHSMGGLTALMLADAHPDRVLSFVDIEGNVGPEDCFLSRQILTHAHADADRFFDDFIERTRHAPAYASALYSASLRHKVRAGAVRGIFESMVELSDDGELMARFLGLPCPRMFMHGAQNRSLSYLGHLRAKGVQLAEIPDCGHFPMYSNPPVMWERIARFVGSCVQPAQPTDPEARLAAAGLALPAPLPPTESYVPFRLIGSTLYVSGHGPRRPDGSYVCGRLATADDVAAGYEAARQAALNMLATVKLALGDLSRVEAVLKVLGMVNAAPEFIHHPKVINGCSDVLITALGDAGRHARSAVGMGSLPHGMTVEVEAVLQVREANSISSESTP